MGGDHEQDVLPSGKEGKVIEGMRVEAEELKDFYKKLRQQNDSHTRSIVGLTTEKEDVRKRIRLLLNKRQAAEGPDFDEYQVNRRISRQYEKIDPSRRKSSVSGKKTSVTTAPSVESEISSDKVEEEAESTLPASVTITVKTN